MPDFDYIVSRFIKGENVKIIPLGSGHINETYAATGRNERYILQSVGTKAFLHPDRIIENAAVISDFLHRRGFHITPEYLAADDRKYYVNCEGLFWRMYRRLDGRTADAGDFIQIKRAGVAFGSFIAALADCDIAVYDELAEFHNTERRFDEMERAVYNSDVLRLEKAEDLIERSRRLSVGAGVIWNALSSGEIPLRIVHNDTRAANVLLGERADYVIDLDTVSRGSLLTDYGDGVRSCCAAENGIDFDKLKAYTDGFLGALDGIITENERRLMAESVKIMCLESAVRRIADYLNGNVYFKVLTDEENLIKARKYLEMAEFTAENKTKINEIINK